MKLEAECVVLQEHTAQGPVLPASPDLGSEGFSDTAVGLLVGVGRA